MAYVYKLMDLKSSVEAILYASKAPISINDVAILLKEDRNSVARALRSLITDYRKRSTALKIVRTGIRYKMQLKDEFYEIALPVAEPEFSQKEVDILGFIASNPQVMRGVIREYFGERYIDSIIHLKRTGMIKSEKYRNTELFSVTKKFYKHFSVSKEQIENISDSDVEQ